MTLWDIWSLIEFIGNKDFEGSIIKPDKFDELTRVVNIDLFRNKIGLPEQYQPGRPIPIEYADVTLKNTDDLKAFKTPLLNRAVTAGVMAFPTNYAHRDTVTYNFVKTINGAATTLPRPVEILRELEFAMRTGNYTKLPTTKNPIGVIRSDGIHIRPVSITAVDSFYYRWPTDTLFSYVEGDGYITYDAGASTEFEWPKDEHLTLTRMILQYVGINLREADLVQYSDMKIKQGK
jgi:hypothetical protein